MKLRYLLLITFICVLFDWAVSERLKQRQSQAVVVEELVEEVDE